MTENVVAFAPRKAPDLIWTCTCGCQTHYAHADGRLECAACENVSQSFNASWREKLGPTPVERVEDEGARRFNITNFDAPGVGLKLLLRTADPEKLVFLVAAFDDGQLKTWAQEIEGAERLDWLDSQLAKTRKLLRRESLG